MDTLPVLFRDAYHCSNVLKRAIIAVRFNPISTKLHLRGTEMKYVPGNEELWRHLAFVVDALEKELSTEVMVDESGYYIAKIDTCIGHGSAEDILAKPRLMKALKERIDGKGIID